GFAAFRRAGVEAACARGDWSGRKRRGIGHSPRLVGAHAESAKIAFAAENRFRRRSERVFRAPAGAQTFPRDSELANCCGSGRVVFGMERSEQAFVRFDSARI